MDQSRKNFLQKLSAGVVAAGLSNQLLAMGNAEIAGDETDFIGEGAPDDESYWKKIAKKYYAVEKDYANLENGYYGIQPIPVLQAYLKNITSVNVGASRFARKDFPGQSNNIKTRLAEFLKVTPEEILITRNATEALNIAIQGYPFKTGDEVILNQLDYFSMIECFRMLEKNGTISVKAFDMPLIPQSEDEIVDIYRKQITPRTKVILLTHVSNINGLIVPVAKISAMAKEKGIDTITDSAHALGQIKFSLPELGSDFVGLNLHKWIGNPIGAGVLYARKGRVKEMNPMFGDVNTATDDISKLGHFGTTPFPVILTIPDSIKFHEMMNIDKVSGRLNYLKNYWINLLRANSNVEIVSPANLSCAIASFRIKGKTAKEVADELYKTYNVLTIQRALGKEGCVRVTPAVFTSVEEINKFIKAVDLIAV